MPKSFQLFPSSPGDPNIDAGDNSLRIFTLAEGILMLVLGMLALIFPLVASVWVTGVVALVFLVAGLISWINALSRARQLDALHTFWLLVVATLLLLLGIWMVGRLASGPAAAASQVAALAQAIGVVFLVEGAVATMVSLSNRQVRGWGWGLVNGLVTLLLGLFVLTMKAFNQVWVLGVLVGISFLFSGVDLLGFSASFHSTSHPRRR
jgi:uncharacterized membrane protein HdeD (DUF308 family)